MQPIQLHPLSTLAGAFAIAVAVLTMGLQQIAPTRIQLLSAEEREILSHLSIVYLDDGQGGQAKTIRLDGANLQIVNGLGATNGYPTDPTSEFFSITNGVGNLIVGYLENDHPNLGTLPRTGSHNLVTGAFHGYDKHGALIAGMGNQTTGIYASAAGGSHNVASGRFATVVGGWNNESSGTRAFVGSGCCNRASGWASAVLGGQGNDAVTSWTTVAGGELNDASAFFATVSGGRLNTASGQHSTVSGGNTRTASGAYDWVAGSLFEDD